MRKAPKTDRRRLQDPELKKRIVNRIMFLADLPDALEFDICARDLVHRLADTIDWDEPSMAAYQKECTFYEFDGKLACARQTVNQSLPRE